MIVIACVICTIIGMIIGWTLSKEYREGIYEPIIEVYKKEVRDNKQFHEYHSKRLTKEIDELQKRNKELDMSVSKCYPTMLQAEIDKLIWASNQVYGNLDDTKMAIEIHIEQLRKELKEYI